MHLQDVEHRCTRIEAAAVRRRRHGRRANGSAGATIRSDCIEQDKMK
jgi:hypothetical protein